MTMQNTSELEQLRHFRRTLHQIPETELNLPETAAQVKEFLAPYSLEIIEPEGVGSSFLACLDLGKKTTLAFRTDMDALPITEKTGCEFASRHEGTMHACGHDGHMAAMLGFASRLESIKDQLQDNILLIFQAGEESPGGAELLCKTGWFDRLNVRAFFGMHLWPVLDEGVIAVRPLEMMAMTSEINVTFKGKSAHAAKYKEGHDAMAAAARFLQEAYEMEASYPDDVFRLLRFGHLEAGSVRNAVAADARLEGTLRSFDDEIFQDMCTRLENIAKTIEKEMQVKVQIELFNGYPSVINDPELTEKMLELNPDIVRLEQPEMIAEDFAFYQREKPGAFIFLGTGTGIPLHADTFDFDESILLRAVDFYTFAALNL